MSTTPRSGPGSLTALELIEVLRFQTTVADALAQLPPSLIRRAGLLHLAEILGVVDRWATTHPPTRARENP